MSKKIILIISMTVLLAVVMGCAGHIHTIGKGPQGGQVIEERQWYILWGLVPINKVDTKAMAGNAVNYEIKTEQSALDVIINIFTSAVTVNSRTVTVTK
jgi:hypothetical protein